MRYTHSLSLVRRQKHAHIVSLIVTLIALSLILVLGFTTLDATRFFGGFIESLSRVSIAYFIALILAVIVSLLVGISPKIEASVVPILDVLQSFPSFALFPVLVVWFGKTAMVTILILIVTMIWPILFTLLSAQKQIRSDLLDAAQAFGARGVKLLFHVLVPLLAPAVVTGSIVAWGEAWEAIIAAEIIVNLPGVGTYLADSASQNNNSVLAIGVVLLLALLFILNKYIWLPLLNITTKYQQDA